MAQRDTILTKFDMDALRKKRAAKTAKSDPAALIEGLKQISPTVEKLEIGQTAKIRIPEGVKVRAFVMSITAKLSNLTPKGAPWEGRTYDTIADPDDGEHGIVYVQRGPDGEAKVRKRGRTGGRRKPVEVAGASTNAAEAKADGSGSVTVDDPKTGALVTA